MPFGSADEVFPRPSPSPCPRMPPRSYSRTPTNFYSRNIHTSNIPCDSSLGHHSLEWITERICSGRDVWCGRSCKPGGVENPLPNAIFDCSEPTFVLTPYSEDTEGFRRALIKGSPINWIVERPGEFKDEVEVLVGIGRVCGAWVDVECWAEGYIISSFTI